MNGTAASTIESTRTDTLVMAVPNPTQNAFSETNSHLSWKRPKAFAPATTMDFVRNLRRFDLMRAPAGPT